MSPCLTASPLFVIFNWFPCLIERSVRSSGRHIIAGFMLSSLSSRLMLCRENARLHNNSLHRAGHLPVTICPTSRHNVVLNTAMVTKLEEGGATLSKGFVRGKHRHNILYKFDITDQGHWMHESAQADVIFVAS